MQLLKNILLQLISRNVSNCCLCFKNSEEDCFSVLDAVVLENNESIENIAMLNYVLGIESLQNLTSETLCCECFTMLLKCYKFMKMCQENNKFCIDTVTNIEKLCDSSKEEIDHYNTLYLALNEDKFANIQYVDKTISKDCNEAIKRYEVISNLANQRDDSSDAFDNSQFLTKEKKKRESKHKEDLIDKIPITEILFDENNLRLFKCKVCLKIFPRLHNLKRHFVRLHAPKDFPCTKCNKSFGSPAILEEHKQESHSGKKAICIECGKKYANTKSLKLHELSHKLILKCDTCGKTFNHQRNYQNHITSKRCGPIQKKRLIDKKYICDYCNKKYSRKGTLRVHILFEHGNANHHICSWCGKKFCSLSKLKAHTVTHTQEKNFSCEICGGCYVTKESLLYHTRRHTGEKPYPCEHCNQMFLSTSRRAEHIKRHHMEPNLECDVCHSKFRGRSCLLRHKKRHFDPNSRLHYAKLAENEV